MAHGWARVRQLINKEGSMKELVLVSSYYVVSIGAAALVVVAEGLPLGFYGGVL